MMTSPLRRKPLVVWFQLVVPTKGKSLLIKLMKRKFLNANFPAMETSSINKRRRGRRRRRTTKRRRRRGNSLEIMKRCGPVKKRRRKITTFSSWYTHYRLLWKSPVSAAAVLLSRC